MAITSILVRSFIQADPLCFAQQVNEDRRKRQVALVDKVIS